MSQTQMFIWGCMSLMTSYKILISFLFKLSSPLPLTTRIELWEYGVEPYPHLGLLLYFSGNASWKPCNAIYMLINEGYNKNTWRRRDSGC